MAAAARGQSQGIVAGDVIAAEVLNGSLGIDHEILWRTPEFSRELDRASPPLVLTRCQLRHLTKLRTIPFDRELQRRFVQTCRPLPGPVNLKKTRVAEIEIGPQRLRS